MSVLKWRHNFYIRQCFSCYYDSNPWAMYADWEGVQEVHQVPEPKGCMCVWRYWDIWTDCRVETGSRDYCVYPRSNDWSSGCQQWYVLSSTWYIVMLQFEIYQVTERFMLKPGILFLCVPFSHIYRSLFLIPVSLLNSSPPLLCNCIRDVSSFFYLLLAHSKVYSPGGLGILGINIDTHWRMGWIWAYGLVGLPTMLKMFTTCRHHSNNKCI